MESTTFNNDIIIKILSLLEFDDVEKVLGILGGRFSISELNYLWMILFDRDFGDLGIKSTNWYMLYATFYKISKDYKYTIPCHNTDLMNFGFKLSCRFGHYPMFLELFSSPKINPSGNDNLAIKWASEMYQVAGNIKIVTDLLKDPRVDPGAEHNYAIRSASREGNDKIVEILLSSPKVDPSDHNNEAIRYASANGHDKVVEKLLVKRPNNMPNADPSANNNSPIITAVKNEHHDVVKVLLSDNRVDPTVQQDLPIRWAFEHGDKVMVKLLDDWYTRTAHVRPSMIS